MPLPTLRKTVLYIDQFFLSAAFRQNLRKFVEAAVRIRKLAMQQLLVCPWSSLHDTETHQWPDAKQQALWEFVKKTAGGHKFAHAASIKSVQTAKGFEAFRKGDPVSNAIDARDAFHENVHEWDNYVWIDIRSRVDDADEVRQSKAAAAKALAGLFERWRSHPRSFAGDFREEWSGYADVIERDYVAWMTTCVAPQNVASVDAPLGTWNAQVFNTLMIEQDPRVAFNDRLGRVRRFLRSDFFSAIPYVDASCRVFASLRKAIRRGELRTFEKAERAMLGFGQDLEMVSVFAPYSDAVFLDRAMHRWITDKECDLPGRYGFRAFSVANWEEFHTFLDSVEQSRPEGHDRWLKAVYGATPA